jgi:hypothetical protein
MPLRAVVLLGLFALILTACGSKEPEATPAPPVTTQATQPEEGTLATAGLTINDPGPAEALEAFIAAAAAGDTEALWALLSPVSRQRLGPTEQEFARKFGDGFRDGVGSFAGTPYTVVLSARDEEGWGVAAIAGNRVRKGQEEFAAYGAAARLDGARWLLELGTPIELKRVLETPEGTLGVEMAANSVIEGAGLWLDGSPVTAQVEGAKSHFVVAGRLPAASSNESVVVAFARTADTAGAGAFPLRSRDESGADTGSSDFTA